MKIATAKQVYRALVLLRLVFVCLPSFVHPVRN